MKILIIGGGNMGLTYAQSFLRSHIVTSEEMMILEKSPEKAEHLSTLKIGTVYGDPKECIDQANLIILAVKPQDTSVLFETIKPYANESQNILSIMAGVKIATIQSSLGVTKVVRAMPNLPAQIGMGMTAFTASDSVTKEELVKIQNLINTTGKSIYVEDENMIDATTAISGSGPAYVFYFMNAMMKEAEHLGFSQPESELLVWQTFMGAINLYQKNDYSCQEWIDKVSSRGGTTEAAIKYFNQQEVSSHTEEGIHKAYDRAVELGS